MAKTKFSLFYSSIVHFLAKNTFLNCLTDKWAYTVPFKSLLTIWVFSIRYLFLGTRCWRQRHLSFTSNRSYISDITICNGVAASGWADFFPCCWNADASLLVFFNSNEDTNSCLTSCYCIGSCIRSHSKWMVSLIFGCSACTVSHAEPWVPRVWIFFTLLEVVHAI